jgi:hypothetical protein
MAASEENQLLRPAGMAENAIPYAASVPLHVARRCF